MNVPIVRSRSIIIIMLVTACILMVPLVAMFLTDHVVWSVFDFVVFANILIAAGLVVDLGLKSVRHHAHRAVVGVAVAAVFFLVWAELAVGVFGTPVAGS